MLHISSTDRLLMVAYGMTGVLMHPYPVAPFAMIGDDTITALSQVAVVFKNKFQKPSSLELIQAPVKTAENKQPSVLAELILTSPIKNSYQTRSHQAILTYPANVSQDHNSSLLQRVVTPAVRSAAPPRVPAWVHNLSPRIFSQDDFLEMVNSNQATALGPSHWTNIKM
jgi:hypothetical protein